MTHAFAEGGGGDLMRAEARDGRRGNIRRSWLGGLRDAIDALVRKSPARFAILVFASLILLWTLLLAWLAILWTWEIAISGAGM